MTREQQAEQNRQQFPLTAALLAEWRAVFGDGVRLIWAREGGREMGAPVPESAP